MPSMFHEIDASLKAESIRSSQGPPGVSYAIRSPPGDQEGPNPPNPWSRDRTAVGIHECDFAEGRRTASSKTPVVFHPATTRARNPKPHQLSDV